MSPDTPLFARVSLGNKRVSLGRASVSVLMIRAMEQMRKFRHSDDMVISIELSPSKLMDSTTFDRAALQEQEFAQQIVTDPKAESPFPGIKIGRVTEVMESPQYQAYERIREPTMRLGLDIRTIERIQLEYLAAFPDCAPYFPKWVA